MRALHAAESGLSVALLTLAGGKVKPLEIDVDAALRWFEGKQGLSLAPEQKRVSAVSDCRATPQIRAGAS